MSKYLLASVAAAGFLLAGAAFVPVWAVSTSDQFTIAQNTEEESAPAPAEGSGSEDRQGGLRELGQSFTVAQQEGGETEGQPQPEEGSEGGGGE